MKVSQTETKLQFHQNYNIVLKFVDDNEKEITISLQKVQDEFLRCFAQLIN